MLKRIAIRTYYPIIAFLALSLMGLAGAIYVAYQQKAFVATNFLATARIQETNLKSLISFNQHKVELIADHLSSREWITNQEFTNFITSILDKNTKDTSVNWLASISRDELAQHARRRAEDLKGTHNFFPRFAAGAFGANDLQGENNFLISLSYPESAYFLPGTIVRDGDPMMPYILDAVQTRQSHIGPIYISSVNPENGPSLMIMAPVFYPKTGSQIRGLVAASFSLKELFAFNLGRVRPSMVNSYIIDRTSSSPTVYDLNNNKIMAPEDAEMLLSRKQPLQYSEDVNLGPSQWTLFATPANGAFESDLTLAILLQAIAILVGIFIAAIVKRTMLQTNKLRKEVNQIITELKHSNEQLEKERVAMEGVANGNIALAEKYLHIKEESEANNRLLNVVMDTLTQGICAFSPDMTLLKWNKNLESILDLPKGTVTEGILYKVLTKHLDQISYQPSADEPGSSAMTNAAEESYLKQDISYFERNLQDGRTLEISMTPMPDGGFIVVYLDITERKKAERIIRHMAHFDSLTGLANRAHFTEKLDGLLNQKRQSDENVALALIDLDNFKCVNDTYGHPIGDALLQRVSEILKYQIRDNDFVARVGGDEFAILFPNISTIEEIMPPLNRMLEQLMKPIFIKGISVEIGASIGISLYPEHAPNLEELIKTADEALYHVKESGRGNIEVASKPNPKAEISVV